MAGHAFDALFAPIAGDSPCGLDLEMEGDAEFMRFQAQIEGVLPDSFLSFDRKEAALAGHIAKASALLKRSADLRVACALAKLAILDGDLPGFAACLDGIAGWLGSRWPGLYPSLLDGDPVLRLIDLRSLDDNPHTVLPLQSATLFKSRRLGPISLRSYLLSEGVIQPRSGFDDDESPEKVPGAGELSGAIREFELADVMAVRSHVARLAVAIDAIEAAIDAETGDAGAFRLSRLRATVTQVSTAVEKVAVLKDPGLAVSADAVQADEAYPDDTGLVTDRHAGTVRTAQDMTDAMNVAAAYFARHEPSSPVRFLLVQAQDLIGKSFFDALSALAPEMASQATMRPGRGLAVTLPLERLAVLLAERDASTAHDDGRESAAADETAEDDGWGHPAGDASADDASDADTTPDAPTTLPSADADNMSGLAEAVPVGRFAAHNRHEAMALLENVALFIRSTEPSSPVPFLLDHARSLAGRDFVALLRDLLPAQVLSVDGE